MKKSLALVLALALPVAASAQQSSSAPAATPKPAAASTDAPKSDAAAKSTTTHKSTTHHTKKSTKKSTDAQARGDPGGQAVSPSHHGLVQRRAVDAARRFFFATLCGP